VTRARPLQLVAVIAIAFALTAGIASLGTAAQRASVSWSLPATADSGTAVPFGWSASLPQGGHLVVQLQGGTTRGWQTILALPSTPSGSGTLPDLPLGAYAVRIAELSQHGTLLAQRAQGLRVFGEVPLATLCHSAAEIVGQPPPRCSPDAGSRKIGAGVFTYAASFSADVGDTTVFSFPRTTCRSLSLQFGVANQQNRRGNVVTLGLVQSALSPQRASATGTLGTLTAPLDGGPWQLSTSATVAVAGAYEVVVNGTASCSSGSGV
jgi:hypothetical protein